MKLKVINSSDGAHNFKRAYAAGEIFSVESINFGNKVYEANKEGSAADYEIKFADATVEDPPFNLPQIPQSMTIETTSTDVNDNYLIGEIFSVEVANLRFSYYLVNKRSKFGERIWHKVKFTNAKIIEVR